MLHDVLCMLHVARFDRCQVSMFVLLTGSFPFDGDDEDTVRLLQPTNKQTNKQTSKRVDTLRRSVALGA
jgi:hypothetical protein